jgi:hypothetical protein
MANAIYPKAKQEMMKGLVDMSGGTVKALLIDTADEAYNAADQFLSDVTGAGIVATSGAFTSKTFTTGTFDADDITFTGVSGDQSEALIIYIDTGVAGTSKLIAFLDTGFTGMPVTPGGGDILVVWDAAGIFTL